MTFSFSIISKCENLSLLKSETIFSWEELRARHTIQIFGQRSRLLREIDRSTKESQKIFKAPPPHARAVRLGSAVGERDVCRGTPILH